jgi:hypothetical protein
MKRRVLSSVLAMGCAALLAGASVASAGTLDQQLETSQTSWIDWAVGDPLVNAQTLTAGISGRLDQVEVPVDKYTPNCGAAPRDLTVEIRSVDGAGTPAQSILGTADIPLAAIPEDRVGPPLAMSEAVLTAPVTVARGTQYAIVLKSTGAAGCIAWYSDPMGSYSRGQAFGSGNSGATFVPRAGSDFPFRTYVVPTPPGSSGERAAALKKCRKKARKHDWSHKQRKKCKKKARRLPV